MWNRLVFTSGCRSNEVNPRVTENGNKNSYKLHFTKRKLNKSNSQEAELQWEIFLILIAIPRPIYFLKSPIVMAIDKIDDLTDKSL